MGIRQMIVGGSMPADSQISYKGYTTSSTTSVTLPTHAAGDLIVVFARANAGDGSITIPAGWTTIGSTSNKFGPLPSSFTAAAYKIATGSSEVSGTWTSAAYMLAAVYDGVASVGTATWWNGGSTTTWSAITVSDSHSWVVGLGFFYDGTGYDNAPTGMTNRGSSNTRLSLNDTASAVSSWSSKTTSGTYPRSATYVLEFVSE